MADPISVLAVAGLIYAGRKMSQNMPSAPRKKEGYTEQERVYMTKNEMPSFAVVAPQQRSTGTEILDMRNRVYDKGVMNNLSPVEKTLVGPGLGVSPAVPSYGGFQQLFRVNPDNVGAYRLTSLPGRSGPAQDTTGGRQTLSPELGHNRPEKTAFLPTRLPPLPARAAELTATTGRETYERTKRTTNRSETGMRTDGLSTAPGKHLVSALRVAEEPTRNKSDFHSESYYQAQPSINSYHGGYTVDPSSQLARESTGSGYTTEQLQKYGFRPDDRRGKINRPGNAGRMNVRENALNQGGVLSSVRIDTSRTDGRVNGANGGWTQNYMPSRFNETNAYKGMQNPYATTASLNVAKNQLQNNPLAKSFV